MRRTPPESLASPVAPMLRRGSSLKELLRFAHSTDSAANIGEQSHAQHAVLVGSKTTKNKTERPYIIKWFSGQMPPEKPLSLEASTYWIPQEYRSTFISTLVNVLTLSKNKRGNTELSELTKKTNYASLITDLALSDTALAENSLIYYKQPFKIARLHYLASFLAVQAQQLSTLEHAELSRRYRDYYRAFLIEDSAFSESDADDALNGAEQGMTLEAVAGTLYQFIGGTDFSPKVRVLMHELPDGKKVPIAIASKKVSHYQTAKDAAIDVLEKIATDNPRHYARLFVSTFALAETDLHDKNWGINKDTGNLIKIDHDLSLYPCNHGAFLQHPSSPNTFYQPDAVFEFISSWDIRNLPFIHDAKPVHFPTFSHSAKKLPFLEDLEKNLAFQQWKYFYFTKALLLTEAHIDLIISESSIGNAALDLKLKQFITAKLAVLKSTLLMLQEYRHFLKNELPKALYQNALLEEVMGYNAEHCGKSIDGSPKKDKEHRSIQIDALQKSIQFLQAESTQKQIELDRNPTLQIQFQVGELIQRMNKEQAFFKTIRDAKTKKILEAQLENSVVKDIQFLLDHTTTPLESLISVLAENIKKLGISERKPLFIYLEYALQKKLPEENTISHLVKNFPDEVVSCIKDISYGSSRKFQLYVTELTKQAPHLLPKVCEVMITERPGLNDAVYTEIVDEKNKAAFEDYSTKNPTHIISKIYCAKEAFEKTLKKYKCKTRFLFSRKVSIEEKAIEKCSQLLLQGSAIFFYDEAKALLQLAKSTSVDNSLKTALAFLLSHFNNDNLLPSESTKYERCFTDSATDPFQLTCEKMAAPTVKEKIFCGC